MSRTHRRRLLGTLLALVVAVAGLPALLTPAMTSAASGLTITLDCYSSRERTTIKNTKSVAVTIKTVGSLYKPYSNEPFSVNRKLAPGKSVTYYTGSGASASSSTTLTRRNIYNNTVSSEGVRVTSSVGSFSKRC
jgi:hypothetical protein